MAGVRSVCIVILRSAILPHCQVIDARCGLPSFAWKNRAQQALKYPASRDSVLVWKLPLCNNRPIIGATALDAASDSYSLCGLDSFSGSVAFQ